MCCTAKNLLKYKIKKYRCSIRNYVRRSGCLFYERFYNFIWDFGKFILKFSKSSILPVLFVMDFGMAILKLIRNSLAIDAGVII